MNEPVPGFLGVKHLNQLYGPLRNGNMPTAFERGDGARAGRHDQRALLLGDVAQVPHHAAAAPPHDTTLNPKGERFAGRAARARGSRLGPCANE